MGSVYRKTFTKPLPAGAEIFTRQGERLARCRPRDGEPRPCTLTPSGNDIGPEATTFTARNRDGRAPIVEVATGCRTEDAARQVLAGLEREAERVRAGLITAAEARIAAHRATP